MLSILARCLCCSALLLMSHSALALVLVDGQPYPDLVEASKNIKNGSVIPVVGNNLIFTPI